MARAGDADGDVELGCDGFAGKTDLPRVRAPAEIARDAARTDCAAKNRRELLEHGKTFGAAETAPARNDDARVFETRRSAGVFLLALDHLRCRVAAACGSNLHHLAISGSIGRKAF